MAQSTNPKATANQCQHEEGSLVEQTRVSSYQNSCQLNPYITKDEIMRKIILINIHNLWKRNVYKTYFSP